MSCLSESSSRSNPPATGFIDIHSHLLPGIDDGCESFEESLECVRRLKSLGYVGTICTPHLASEMFPELRFDHVQSQVMCLSRRLTEAGEDYRLWSGGEFRLHKEGLAWLKTHGVPTLAGSRCVLSDFWLYPWPNWIYDTYRWLIDQGHQPILAHPERLPAGPDLEANLKRVTDMGVLLQGNFRCMTGEEGFMADKLVRQWLSQGRYGLLAMDMHGPDSLQGRIDGFSLVEAEFGRPLLERMLADAPRRIIFGHQ